MTRSLTRSRVALHAVLLLGGIGTVLPFLWMISTSLKAPQEVIQFPPTWVPRGLYAQIEGQEVEVEVTSNRGEGRVVVRPYLPPANISPDAFEVASADLEQHIRFRWENYKEAFVGARVLRQAEREGWEGWRTWLRELYERPTFLRYFLNTVFISGTVLAGVLFTTCLAAFAFGRLEFRGREILFLLFLSMMMIPEPVYLVPSFLILAKIGWIDTYEALIVPWTVNVFSIFLLRQHFKTIPKDLEDAATIDGCSRWRFLWQILVPISKAPLVTVSLFSVIGSWNSFMWPLVMINSEELRPLQVGLANFAAGEGADHHLMMAAATFCILPLLVVYFFAQKHIMSSHAESGIKG